jgi:spermidine synthase
VSDAPDWFVEPPTRGYEQRYQVRRRIYTGQSSYQCVEVLDTVPFGRMLTLDGLAQTTEADEHTYHEMLVHVPMFQHPGPRRVLVIGGGDGGTLRRVLEHPVERVVMVELDELVVSACREHLPAISAGAFDDSRAELMIGDGARFLAESDERFDVILVDSTDPIGAAQVLFSEPFFRSAHRALNTGGLYAMQSGSPLLQAEEMAGAAQGLRAVFPDVRLYLGSVPVYPGILWSFTLAARDGAIQAADPAVIRERMIAAGIQTATYTPELHRAAFALPGYVAAALDGAGGTHGHPLPGS